jgi:proteasome alpha subunit
MAMFADSGSYDQALTVFSPDGRQYQVEYALEVVHRGATVLGIACPEGVVLAADTQPSSPLQNPDSAWKLFQVDTHIGVAISGLSADARILVDRARLVAQINRLTYDDSIAVNVLARQVAEIMTQYTQYGGVRPFGVSMIFGGVDRQRSHLFQTDPSGACWKYHAIALGSGSETVNALLEAKMTPNLTLDQAIQLAIGCLAQVIEGPLDATRITIITIPQVTARFTTLSDTEVTPYIQNTRS